MLTDCTYSLDRELSISELIQFLNPGGPFSELFAERPYANFVRDLERLSTLRGLWSETYASFLSP